MLSATAGRTDTDKAAVNTPGKCRSDMATPEKRPYISVAALISQPAARRHIGIIKACHIIIPLLTSLLPVRGSPMPSKLPAPFLLNLPEFPSELKMLPDDSLKQINKYISPANYQHTVAMEAAVTCCSREKPQATKFAVRKIPVITLTICSIFWLIPKEDTFLIPWNKPRNADAIQMIIIAGSMAFRQRSTRLSGAKFSIIHGSAR